MEKVSILVDVQNIYYTTRQIYGRHFDYQAFWQSASAGRKIINAVAYAIDRNDEKQMKFQKILKTIGFTVKLKPFIQRSDGTAKGDWDVGITIDALDFAKHSDTLILVSGDGDFDLLVKKVRQEHGVNVEIYSVFQLTSTSLISAATKHIPIGNTLLMKPRL